MAIDVKAEAKNVARMGTVKARKYWIEDLVTRAVVEAKREQMEADCKAVCDRCKLVRKVEWKQLLKRWMHIQANATSLMGVECEASPIRTAFAATEPRAHEEVCWLIERGQQEGQSPPAWWAGDGSGTCLAWSFDANKAIKYPTKAAAEAALDSISGIKGVHSPMGHVTEHAFVDPSATEPRDIGKDAARELGLDGDA